MRTRACRSQRTLVAGLVAGLIGAACTWTRPARGDLWGGDLPLLAGILAEAFAEVSNLSSMVTQVVEQVRLLKTLISGLDSRSFAAVTEVLRDAERTQAALTTGIQSMSYSLQRIDDEFGALYPSDPRPSLEQRTVYYARWNQEVLAASHVAARQQSLIEKLGDRANEARDLVVQSQNAAGEIGQLQLVVQMLSIMHAQLLTIDQTLATTGRVLTDMSATSASASQLSLAKKADSLSNYTSRGDPVRVPIRLP